MSASPSIPTIPAFPFPPPATPKALGDGGETASTPELDALNAQFATSHPREILHWAAGAFGESLVMTSSFGADSMCTIHLATQVMPNIRILMINTGYLFPETLAFMEEVRTKFKLNVLEFHTHNDPVVWLTVNGEPDPHVRNNIDACCAANKNSVMDRAMKETAPAAWIRGVRADQSQERAKMQILQWHRRNNCWALSPILRWTTRDVYNYMKEHNLPHHPLYEKGYVSIGCNPLTCTRAIGVDDDQRSGRWAGTEKTECGINLDLGKNI